MRLLLVVLLALVGPAAFSAGLSGVNAPVKKFRLPAFNDQGFRSSLLEGDAATMVSSTQIDVKEMHFTLFAGDEKGSIETTLLAPVATVRILEKDKILVEGKRSVRLVRSDLDVSGEDWTYQHSDKHLAIRKNVRVVVHAELKDILK